MARISLWKRTGAELGKDLSFAQCRWYFQQETFWVWSLAGCSELTKCLEVPGFVWIWIASLCRKGASQEISLSSHKEEKVYLARQDDCYWKEASMAICCSSYLLKCKGTNSYFTCKSPAVHEVIKRGVFWVLAAVNGEGNCFPDLYYLSWFHLSIFSYLALVKKGSL